MGMGLPLLGVLVVFLDNVLLKDGTTVGSTLLDHVKLTYVIFCSDDVISVVACFNRCFFSAGKWLMDVFHIAKWCRQTQILFS